MKRRVQADLDRIMINDQGLHDPVAKATAILQLDGQGGPFCFRFVEDPHFRDPTHGYRFRNLRLAQAFALCIRHQWPVCPKDIVDVVGPNGACYPAAYFKTIPPAYQKIAPTFP